MSIQVLPAALDDISFLRRSRFRGTGLLLGAEVGRVRLVERLLPAPFDRRELDGSCGALAASHPRGQLGVFFCRCRPFAHEWFLGGLVLDIGARATAALCCDWSGGRPRLLPLLEESCPGK